MMQDLYNEAVEDTLQKVIDAIENARLTNGVYTTYDQSMMNSCKLQIISMLREKFNVK